MYKIFLTYKNFFQQFNFDKFKNENYFYLNNAEDQEKIEKAIEILKSKKEKHKKVTLSIGIIELSI